MICNESGVMNDMTQQHYLDFLRDLHANNSLNVQPEPGTDEGTLVSNVDSETESSKISVIDEEIGDVMRSNLVDYSARKDEFMRQLQYA